MKKESSNEEVYVKKKTEISEYLAAIFIGVAILLAGTTYLFYTKWRSEKGEGVVLQSQGSVMEQREKAANFNLQKELDESERKLNSITDSNTIQIKLKGLKLSPSSKAVVYYNKTTGDIFLRIHQLPELSDSKVYQLWALKDGKNIDAGVFTLENPVNKMKNVDGAQSFMVTQEKIGGSTEPDMKAMYLMEYEIVNIKFK